MYHPFGYGLTYGDVHVLSARIEEKEGQRVLLSEVENWGSRETEEVLQVYVKNMDSSFAPRNPVLCGFSRISLGAGEKKQIEIRIPSQAFEIVDDKGNRREEGRNFLFYAGCSQPDERSRELTGKTPVEIFYEKN